MSPSEKRAHFRQSLHANAIVTDSAAAGESAAQLLDISVGGAALLLKSHSPAGNLHLLRFALPGAVRPVSCMVQVMYCAPHTFLGGFRAGVKFTDIGEGDLRMIADFISAQAAAKA